MHRQPWTDTHIHVSNATPDGTPRADILADLLAVLDADGADLRFVVSPDFPWPGRMTKDPAMLQAGNDFIHDLVQRAPGRLYGACSVNANFLTESLRTMEVCFERHGFVLLGEMLQYIMGYQMNCDATAQLTRHAARYNVPVQVHISTSNAGPQGQFRRGGTEQMEDLLGLVERVPEAKYILAHLIGMPKADPPVVAGYIDQVETRFGRWPDNFWAEIRDFSSPGLKYALERIPHSRLIAGTDWVTRIGPPFQPYGMIFATADTGQNPYPPRVASMVELLRQAGADADAIADIAWRNAAGLLRV